MIRGVGEGLNHVLRRGGIELRPIDPTRDPRSRHVHPIREFSDRALAIERRHEAQTPETVEALRRNYAAPVFGCVTVWELLERLSGCIDPTGPDLLLTGLIHDLGKLLLLTGEDPANVVCPNAPLSGEPGAGLASAVFPWNHDSSVTRASRSTCPIMSPG